MSPLSEYHYLASGDDNERKTWAPLFIPAVGKICGLAVRVPLSLVRIIEELLDWKSSDSDLEN
jgi:hypothetical protein